MERLARPEKPTKMREQAVVHICGYLANEDVDRDREFRKV